MTEVTEHTHTGACEPESPLVPPSSFHMPVSRASHWGDSLV